LRPCPFLPIRDFAVQRTIDIPDQQALFGRPMPAADETPKTTVPEHTRGRGKKGLPDGCVNAEGLRFGPDVPVKTIQLEPEGIEGLSPEDYEIIGVQTRHKLAQQASSYTVLRYEQPVIKLRGNGQILPVVPVPSVLERSLADVSLLAGLLSDKFVSHLPLYRQHQRMEAAGITVSRATLTNLVRRSIDLLAPIAEAQWQHILASKVLAMDETPIKAGKSRTKKGRMHQGYFWPIYGDNNEIVFTYAGSRARHVIERILTEQFRGTLLSDGYAAYASYCHRQSPADSGERGRFVRPALEYAQPLRSKLEASSSKERSRHFAFKHCQSLEVLFRSCANTNSSLSVHTA